MILSGNEPSTRSCDQQRQKTIDPTKRLLIAKQFHEQSFERTLTPIQRRLNRPAPQSHQTQTETASRNLPLIGGRRHWSVLNLNILRLQHLRVGRSTTTDKILARCNLSRLNRTVISNDHRLRSSNNIRIIRPIQNHLFLLRIRSGRYLIRAATIPAATFGKAMSNMTRRNRRLLLDQRFRPTIACCRSPAVIVRQDEPIRLPPTPTPSIPWATKVLANPARTSLAISIRVWILGAYRTT